jgi:hypothetical protein
MIGKDEGLHILAFDKFEAFFIVFGLGRESDEISFVRHGWKRSGLRYYL